MNTCVATGCRNPVPSLGTYCGRHGGETAPAWAVYEQYAGWLTSHEVDVPVARTFSHDIDDAMWFSSREEADEIVRRSAFSSFYEVVRVK